MLRLSIKIPATATVTDMFTSSGCAELGATDFTSDTARSMCAACGSTFVHVPFAPEISEPEEQEGNTESEDKTN